MGVYPVRQWPAAGLELPLSVAVDEAHWACTLLLRHVRVWRIFLFMGLVHAGYCADALSWSDVVNNTNGRSQGETKNREKRCLPLKYGLRKI